MKKGLKLLVFTLGVFLICIIPNVVFASESKLTEDGEFYYKEIENPAGIRILRYEGNRKEVKVPDQIDGMPVVEIEDGAFEYRMTIEKINLPDTVINIGKEGEMGAFSGCFKLKEINLPSNLEVIGKSTFEYTSLEKVVIPEKVTWIQNFCFAGCSKLKEVEFKGNCKKIGAGAFLKCRSLKSMVLPDSVN